ncbi:hypothetical protein OEZ86_006973 [Tetradesmus obliquus]|nr:hypothetical protein OEZ86_006973 [Tetradesmus obliquus]
MGDDGSRYSFRKRRRPQQDGVDEALSQLLELTASCGRLVIFSGSGLSANSGMSMFSTKNGLYERARQRFKIQDGIKLFSYPFYKQRRMDVQQFFAQIYGEAKNSKASPGHVAIAQLHELGKLQRHYTLNIDGLAEVVGMDTWHHEKNPEGITVEMHGNISYVVCPSCHATERLSGPVMATMKAAQPLACTACGQDEMRFKVMLYDDEEGDCITPEDVFERLEDDLAVADGVLWVGISFEQSASTEYFRKVRHMLAAAGRLGSVVQVVINPSDEAAFNVLSTVSKREDVKLLDVRGTSDDVLPAMVSALHAASGTSPDPTSISCSSS